jgi:hypothetical protein
MKDSAQEDQRVMATVFMVLPKPPVERESTCVLRVPTIRPSMRKPLKR